MHCPDIDLPRLSGDSIAERLDRLQAQNGHLSSVLDFRLTTRRAFLLLLATGGPVGASDVRRALDDLGDARLPPMLHRLRHYRVAYAELTQLEVFGAVHRRVVDGRVRFEIDAFVRRILAGA